MSLINKNHNLFDETQILKENNIKLENNRKNNKI